MGGYGALVLDTIGTAATPVLLLIGEENKHHKAEDGAVGVGQRHGGYTCVQDRLRVQCQRGSTLTTV